MIYTDIQLKEKIMQMLESFESEVVEFKEAKTNYSFNDIANIFLRLAMKQISVAFRKRGWCSAFLMTRNLQGQNSENKAGCRV